MSNSLDQIRPDKHQAWSGSKLFDTLMVFLKEFFKKVDFEKDKQMTKNMKKIPRGAKSLAIHTMSFQDSRSVYFS